MTVGAGPAVAGAELELRVVARNQGAEPRTLRLRLALAPIRYTGVAGPPFRQEQHRRAVPPGQGEDPPGDPSPKVTPPQRPVPPSPQRRR